MLASAMERDPQGGADLPSPASDFTSLAANPPDFPEAQRATLSYPRQCPIKHKSSSLGVQEDGKCGKKYTCFIDEKS